MKIKQLDIVGFKSFGEKTTVLFPEGISAVVGPNGCGKSNIVDALRWVMGEQSVKQLRGKATEDVIFAGTEKQPPMNMAEVALTMVNDNAGTPEEYRHFPEITVSRRLFRSGESCYFINKRTCRLKDVQDLLLGTGIGPRTYAIIEQGKISSMIDAGPEDRRGFIEEVAGITRYKSRKHEALLKMQRTQRNLVRLGDVISEVGRQRENFKRQAQKAERYKTYQQQIRELDVTIATHLHQTTTTEILKNNLVQQQLGDTESGHKSELAKLDAAVVLIKEQRANKHMAIADQKAKAHELQRTIDKLEGTVDYSKKELQRFAEDRKRLEAEVKEICDKNDGVGEECQKLAQSAQELEQSIRKANEELKKAQEKELVEKSETTRLSQTMETNKNKMIDLARRKASHENVLENTLKQKAASAQRLDQIRKERSDAETELVTLSRGIEGISNQNQTLLSQLKQLESSIQSLEATLKERRQALNEQLRLINGLEAEKQKARSRHGALKKMEDNYEWFKNGVQAIMKKWKSQNPDSNGIHCLVADVIEPAATYEDAVEAALGEALQYIIVEDQQHALSAIGFLESQSAGRSGFIPKNALRGLADSPLASANAEPTVTNGCQSLLTNLKIKEGYENLVHSLLGHINVSDDLESARATWNRNGVKQVIVTRKGERLCLHGTLFGGSSESAGPGILAKKKEIRFLASQIEALETDIRSAKEIQTQIEAHVTSLEGQLQSSKDSQRKAAQAQMETEKELYRQEEKRKHRSHHLEVLNQETLKIEHEQMDLEKEFIGHQEGLSTLTQEIQRAEQEVARLNSALKEATINLEETHQEAVALRVNLTGLQARKENCTSTLNRLQDFQRERESKLERLKIDIQRKEQDALARQEALKSGEAGLGSLYEELKLMEKILAEGEAEYQKIEKALAENDRALSSLRTAQAETQGKLRQLELAQSERRMRCEHLVSRMQESYNYNLESGQEYVVPDDFRHEEAQKELSLCRERIGKIGDVNMTAIEEFEEMDKRYTLLTNQQKDLLEALEALNQVIRKINRTSLKQFELVFNAVNEQLQSVFSRLFEGGSARLELVDPNNALESGVSYLVQPPGKKLTRMSLLSGGEKALCAIALVFSFFLIKPAAFCVLDEIDAPLDDANIDRFNGLLKEIGKLSQIVMVTHSKQAMEMADALFGVTMEHKGLSKLISLNLGKRGTAVRPGNIDIAPETLYDKSEPARLDS